MRYSRHIDCSPAAHHSHRPQERIGLTTTRVPTATPLTPGPASSTTPATSPPVMAGRGKRPHGYTGRPPGEPLLAHTSRLFSATARTRTRTSPGPGRGVG